MLKWLYVIQVCVDSERNNEEVGKDKNLNNVHH